MSITSLMDDTCLIAESTDQVLLDKMDQQFAKHAHYVSSKSSNVVKIGKTEFRLKHYAGDVTYNVFGMLDKVRSGGGGGALLCCCLPLLFSCFYSQNKDTLFVDIIKCLGSSKIALMQELFPPVDTKKRPETASFQFKAALANLLEKLMSTHAHYIRCIKPNDTKAANKLDDERVRHQVRYLG
jgi:myosin-1